MRYFSVDFQKDNSDLSTKLGEKFQRIVAIDLFKYIVRQIESVNIPAALARSMRWILEVLVV